MSSAIDLLNRIIMARALDATPLVHMTLAQHDAAKHPHGFDPEHDSCKFRERLEELDEIDKLYVASDIHHSKLEDITPDGHKTMILAGDVMGTGYFSDEEGAKWVKKEFLPWLESHSDKNIVIVPGNHDLFLEKYKDKIKWPENVTFLDGKGMEINGMKVFGTPWCRMHMGGAYEVGSERLKEEFDKIPEGLDILIAHTPPHIKGEKIDYDEKSRSYFGSEELTEAILKKKPKLVICGHVHTGSHKPVKIGDTTVVNVSLVGTDRDKRVFGARTIGITKSEEGTEFLMDMDNDMRVKTDVDEKPTVEKSPNTKEETEDTEGEGLGDFFEMLRDEREDNAVLLPDAFTDFYFAVVKVAKEINAQIDKMKYHPDEKSLKAMKEAWPAFQEYRKAHPDNPSVSAVLLSAWEIAESARKKFRARVNRVMPLPTSMGDPTDESKRYSFYSDIHGITDRFDKGSRSSLPGMSTTSSADKTRSELLHRGNDKHDRGGEDGKSHDSHGLEAVDKPRAKPERRHVKSFGSFADWAKKHGSRWK